MPRAAPTLPLPILLLVLPFAAPVLPCVSPARADPPTLADVLSQRIERYGGEIRIDPASGRIDGEVALDVVVTGPGRPALHFSTPIPVIGASDASGGPLPTSTVQVGGRALLRVELPAPLPDGAGATVRLRIDGTPSCAPRGTIEWRPCGFGDVTWLDLSVVLPASVTFAGERATMDLGVDLPAGLALAGTGLDAGAVPSAPGRERHRLVQDAPSVLHALAAGPFETGSAPGTEGFVRTFTLPDPAVRARVPAVIAEAASALAFCAARWGPPPVPGVSIVQVDAGAAWATAGMIWLPRGIWTGQGGGTIHPPDLWRLVLPHEVAHQWFPVGARPEPGSAWIAEALAEFAAIDFLAAIGAADGVATAQRLSLEYRRLVDPLDDFPLAGSSADAAGSRDLWFRVAYAKGALVLRALRQVAGADAFRSGVAALYAEHSGQGPFDAGRLRDLVAAAAGADLRWLFREQVERPGHPILRVRAWSEPLPGGEYRVRVRVEATSSVFGVAFSLPLPFRVATTAGTYARTELVAGPDTEVAWDLPGRLLGVDVDPGHAFVRRVLPEVPGDVDLSGEVDGIDVVAVAWSRGAAWPDGRYSEAADLDDSGAVDQADLDAVLEAFGAP
ncbi:MAG: hypothetical protein FJ087_17290 [Deltaproteobacteria bacterium]|nr:hypothetical protein [Deltaproteobacteria bacterium]